MKNSAHIDDPHGELAAACFRFAIGAAFVLALLAAMLILAACTATPSTSGNIVAGQTPGQATGAGSTFTGPANSAAPSTQTAKRRVGFYPRPIFEKLPRFLGGPATEAVGNKQKAVSPDPLKNATAFDLSGAPGPAWFEEQVTTTFGQHQDAAMLIKAAGFLGSWGKMRWIGVLCLFIAYSGLLWAHGNDESGYPVVCWKIAACGIVFVILDASLWWLLLLLIPAGLYFAQKLKLLRLMLP